MLLLLEHVLEVGLNASARRLAALDYVSGKFEFEGLECDQVVLLLEKGLVCVECWRGFGLFLVYYKFEFIS